jgi:hypothetical protein
MGALMQPEQIQEFIRRAAKREQERAAAELAEAQIKVTTASFDKAAAYTNLMLLGGYAGFFGLWQLTKDFLTKPQALWAALLVLASLAAFVLFEVVKMVLVHRRVIAQLVVLRSPAARASPESLMHSLNELEAAQDMNSKPFLLFWATTVAFTVGTGLAGASVLAYAFIAGLAT